MDASWYLDNPSGELIERLAQERKDHIERTLAQRQSGAVGRPLDQLLEQSRVQLASVTDPQADHQSDRDSGLVTESSEGLTLSLSSHSSQP